MPQSLFHGRRLDAMGAIALALGFVALAYTVSSPAEDAVILFDYAANLAERGLITYSNHDVPIEGATDFLWMALIGGLDALGIDPWIGSLLLNGAAAGVVFAVLARRSSPTFAAAALLGSPFIYASMVGFSALFFSAAIVIQYLCLTRRAWRAFYLVTLLVCLIRPDGFVYSALPAAYALHAGWREGGMAHVRDFALLLLLPGLAYFGARWLYFGEMLPLPFLVKAGGARDILGLFHADSLRPVLSVALPALLILLYAGGPMRPARVLGFVVVPALFYLAVRLEQNVGNRFLAPVFFVAAVELAGLQATRRALAWATLAIVLLVNGPTTARTALELTTAGGERIAVLARALAANPGKMLVTEAGRLSYYSGDWLVEDAWGLNTPRYARTPISTADIEAGGYDLIAAHCDLSILRDETAPRPSAGRSWAAMCDEIGRHLQAAAERYTVFLVPTSLEPAHAGPATRAILRARTIFRALRRIAGLPVATEHAGCARHDIYAVRRDSARFRGIAQTLEEHGAVAYAPSLEIDGDALCRRAERDNAAERAPAASRS